MLLGSISVVLFDHFCLWIVKNAKSKLTHSSFLSKLLSRRFACLTRLRKLASTVTTLFLFYLLKPNSAVYKGRFEIHVQFLSNWTIRLGIFLSDLVLTELKEIQKWYDNGLDRFGWLVYSERSGWDSIPTLLFVLFPLWMFLCMLLLVSVGERWLQNPSQPTKLTEKSKLKGELARFCSNCFMYHSCWSWTLYSLKIISNLHDLVQVSFSKRESISEWTTVHGLVENKLNSSCWSDFVDA